MKHPHLLQGCRRILRGEPPVLPLVAAECVHPIVIIPLVIVVRKTKEEVFHQFHHRRTLSTAEENTGRYAFRAFAISTVVDASTSRAALLLELALSECLILLLAFLVLSLSLGICFFLSLTLCRSSLLRLQPFGELALLRENNLRGCGEQWCWSTDLASTRPRIVYFSIRKSCRSRLPISDLISIW